MDFFANYNQRESSEKDLFGREILTEHVIYEPPEQQDGESNTILARIRRFASKLGVEERGIERVLPEDRTDTKVSSIGTLWLSTNLTVSAFAIGALAKPAFSLGFVDAALTIVFFNLLGILPICFFSTLGPRFGLRQMVLSKYYFGYYGAKLIAAFNVVACLGWASVNLIVGAQLLASVNPMAKLPGWAGILIIALSTLLITTFGYKIIHVYERWSWLPVFIIFLIVAGEFGRSGDFQALLPLQSGPNEAGSVLSFAASIFGSAIGWTTCAADYTVYQPARASRRAIFGWTFLGLFAPLVGCQLLGAAVMTAASKKESIGVINPYTLAYFETGAGGLLAQVLVPSLGGFGRFCLVVLALSIVANNCPNLYSVGLSLQVLGQWTARVPRYLWTILATAVYVAIAIPGYTMFQSFLENLMLCIGYWLAIYMAIALTEHFVFREGPVARWLAGGSRGNGYYGYAVEHGEYERPGSLPPGMAAMSAFGMGVIGAVLGMAQEWFVGPVGRISGGDMGGDVGFELAFAFAAVSYLGLRAIERGYYKR